MHDTHKHITLSETNLIVCEKILLNLFTSTQIIYDLLLIFVVVYL